MKALCLPCLATEFFLQLPDIIVLSGHILLIFFQMAIKDSYLPLQIPKICLCIRRFEVVFSQIILQEDSFTVIARLIDTKINLFFKSLINTFIQKKDAESEAERKFRCPRIRLFQIFPEIMGAHDIPIDFILADIMEQHDPIRPQAFLPVRKIMFHILIMMGAVDMQYINRARSKTLHSLVKGSPQHFHIRI